MLLKPPAREGSSDRQTRQALLSDFAFTRHLPAAPFDIRIRIAYWSILALPLCFVIVHAIQKGEIPGQALQSVLYRELEHV